MGDINNFVKHWYFGRRRFVNKNSCLEACVKIASYFRDTVPSEKPSQNIFLKIYFHVIKDLLLLGL